MAIKNILRHYKKMKMIVEIIERGEWRKHPAIAKLTIEQVENMRATLNEFEEMGIKQALVKYSMD